MKVNEKWMLFGIATFVTFLGIGNYFVKGTKAVEAIETIYVSDYDDLSNAVSKVNASTNKYKIILQDNINLDTYLQIGSEDGSVVPNVILELGTYYITSKEEPDASGYKFEYSLKNYGNLEINATTGGIRSGSVDEKTLSDMVIVNNKNMTINGGNYYDGATNGYGQIINNHGMLVINGGNFTLKKHSSIIFANDGEAVINDGKFDFTVLEGSNDESFKNKDTGKLTINGGEIDGGGYGIVNYSQLIINGGDIVGNTAAICNGRPTDSDFNEKAIVTINNGNITTLVKGENSGSSREVIYNSGIVNIEGGLLKVINDGLDVRVSVFYNYGKQTLNGGTFIAETTKSGYINGMRNLGDNGISYFNGGIFKLKDGALKYNEVENDLDYYYFYDISVGQIKERVIIPSNYEFYLIDDSEYLTSSVREIAEYYNVTYESNGGVLDEETFEVMYNASYGDLRIPSKKGYTFVGWFLEDSFKTQVTKDTIVKTQGDHKLYAKWDVISFKLTIDANGGVYSGDSEILMNYNDTSIIEEPIRSGYKFIKWILSGTESKFEDSVFTMGISDSKLTASWELDEFNIDEISDYEIKGNLITNIPLGLDVNDFKLGLEDTYLVKIYNKNEVLKTQGVMATGDIVNIYLDDLLVRQYIVVIKGDIDGDGLLNALDIKKISTHIIDGKLISGEANLEAADISCDNRIDINDVIKLTKYINEDIEL